MNETQDRCTRITARWLDVKIHQHPTSVYMPMCSGGLDGVEAVRAGLLQLVTTPDKKITFRPLYGAN